MSRRVRCTCGERYEDFRTGETYQSVLASMYSGPDPDTWVRKHRAAVMARWAELKRNLWDERHQACPEVFEVVDPAVPFDCAAFVSAAGAKAFARMRARQMGRPGRLEVRGGTVTLEAWEGDHRGRARRAA